MKKLFTLFIGIILFSEIFSQNTIEWQKTIGGNNADYLYSITQTIDGGFILGGNSSSNISGDKTEDSKGAHDYWIIKIDSIGNIIWQKTIGGSNDDKLCSISQTLDGGYILGGTSNSNISGDKTENSNGFKDYWIVKLDFLGNIQWQNTIGGSSDDILFSLQLVNDGGFILGGTSNSDTSGDKTQNSKGLVDYWIVKMDSLGNVEWDKTIGGSAQDWLYSIDITIDGGFILGGSSYSGISGDKTVNSLGYDYWIVKTNSIGNIEWQNTYGGNASDYLIKLAATNDGGYILGGIHGHLFQATKLKTVIKLIIGLLKLILLVISYGKTL